MTREEVLDWLYRLKSEIFVFMPKEWMIPMADALDVGIKALEHPEKNVVTIEPTVYPTEADYIKANTQLKKQIEMLKLDRECDKPSGKWIYDGHHLRCSNCNDYHAIKDSDWNLIASNYCPKCGAKMVEEQGEAE